MCFSSMTRSDFHLAFLQLLLVTSKTDGGRMLSQLERLSVHGITTVRSKTSSIVSGMIQRVPTIEKSQYRICRKRTANRFFIGLFRQSARVAVGNHRDT